jgi:excinuclease ABC subunit C
MEILNNLFVNTDGTVDLPFEVWSIAKKEERYFRAPSGEELFLSKHSDGSKLLQRARDEAHRFGVTHVRGKSDKKLVASKLEDIPGVGPNMKKKLIQAFGSLKSVKQATIEELGFVVGNKNAQKIKEFLG